jgi:hypothetical protein
MKKKNAEFILISVLLTLASCASTGVSMNTASGPGSTFSGNTADAIESFEKIDNWKTFETFFILNQPEDCIKISINSEIFDELESKKIFLKTYYIIEKAVDVSKFRKENTILFSELGRNFDYNWTAKQELTICSIDSDPIKRLDRTNKIRIRFTTFKENSFKYTIIINSKYPINIGDKNSGNK